MESKVQSMREAMRSEAEQLQQIQKDMQRNATARSQFTQQQNENKMVLSELELLDEEANVYKLIGPALIKQDPVEAKSNVQKRLEFIGHELGRLESQLKQIEDKGLQKQNQIIKMQQEFQRLQHSTAA